MFPGFARDESEELRRAAVRNPLEHRGRVAGRRQAGRTCRAVSSRRPTRAPSAPRTGRALFAWTKDQDGRFEYGLLKHLNAWAKSQEFPARMVDWDAEQVSRAYAGSSPPAAGAPGDAAWGRSRALELSSSSQTCRREHDQG